ncbi:MAG: PAS domain S-box protein [Anaerolineae bacterium]|nr:PAS domain S-box protein [Anaerolineae bacterium]
MRNSIRTRLTVTLIGLAIGPLLVAGVILARQSFTIQTRQALDLQREVARRVATQVTAFFEELEHELSLASKMYALPELDQDEKHSIFKLLIAQDVFERLVLLDSQGRTQVYLTRLARLSTEPDDYTQADEFVVPQTTGEVYYSPVRLEVTTGEPLITIAIPLLDVQTGLADGVLVSEVRLKKIWDLIADVRVSPGQSIYIVDAQGNVVAHQNPSVVLRGTRFAVPKQDGIQPGLAGSSAVLAIDMVHVSQQEFNIVVEQATPEALTLAINTVYVTVSVVVATLVVAGMLGFLIVRQIVRPIQTMATTARVISAGDLSQQVPVTRHDELGILASTFNDMTGQLGTVINDLEQQIAERKRAEESLREVNETLQALFDHSPLAIIVIDLDSHVLLWNKAAESMYGWTAQEVRGELLSTIPRDKLKEHQTIRDRVTNGESMTNLELIRQRKDGSTFFLEASIAPLRDATGKVYAQVSIGADITERKQAEEALRKKTEELDQFFTVSLDLLCIADTEGYFRRLNPQWEIILGYSLSELEGQRFLDLVHPDDQASTVAALDDLGAQRAVLNFVNRYRCKDGSYSWIEWRSYPVGNLIYAAARDITERKQAENEREELIAELETKNAELERFTYTVSHDLKSPLITIKGFLGLLAQDAAVGNKDRLEHDIHTINTAADKMQQLLDDLLELSRIGRLMNPPEEVSFDAIAHEAIELVRGRIVAHGVEIVIAPDLPIVYGDRARLVEVVQNLVDNACKFMGGQLYPRIEIGVRHSSATSDGGEVIFYVRDNGIGIEPKYQDRIFDLFTKLDPTSEGTGIGLAIVKRIVEIHNGTIWVESAGKGSGTTFYFTLPAKIKEDNTR